MKIIKKKNLEGIVSQVQYEDYSKGHVRIFQVSGEGIYGSKEPQKYGVNWSAHGTQTLEEARAYIKLMEVAIREAEKLNKG